VIRDGILLAILVWLNILIFKRINETIKKKKIMTSTVRALASPKGLDEHDQVSTTTQVPRSSIAITKSRQSVSAPSQPKDKNKESQKKNTKMVLADCLNSILGRLPVMIYFILSNALDPNLVSIIKPIFSTVTFLSVYASFGLKFFIYYNFNKRFRSIYKKNFAIVKQFFISIFCCKCLRR
jgi:hypothetical protein